MRILLDEAQLGWDEAWDLTTAHAGLHESHAAARGAGEVAAALVRDAAAAPARDHPRDQPAFPRRACARRFPDDGDRLARVEPDRGRRSHRRFAWRTSPSSDPTAPTAWRRFIPICSRRPSCRTLPSSIPSGSTTRRTASRSAASSCWPIRRCRAVITDAIGDGWITDLEPAREARAARSRQDVPCGSSRGQARRQDALCGAG